MKSEPDGPEKHKRSQGFTGTIDMARFEFGTAETATMGADAQGDILYDMGMMYATGRDCATDLIAAHKWFNIAAIKGCERAAQMRSELSASMSKLEIAQALRAAREWMTTH
jgi:uncharacterized protein